MTIHSFVLENGPPFASIPVVILEENARTVIHVKLREEAILHIKFILALTPYYFITTIFNPL